MSTRRRTFITDCEGPVTRNDNAFELSEHFIPDGDRFFALLSRYDDVLAYVDERRGYKAGDTLRLIIPFLKVYGATDETIRAYSSRNILLMPGAKETMSFVRRKMPSFIVSTSYEPYIRALCDAIQFPFENVHCTRLIIDTYSLPTSEIKRLKEMREEISAMPMSEIPNGAKSIEDFSPKDQRTIKRLDQLFWEEIRSMEADKMLRGVNPIGGYEKARAVRTIVGRLNVDLSDVMYVGDSITDVQALRVVRENGGLSISFNGNRYAVTEAEVAVLTESMVILSILAETFNEGGKEKTLSLLRAHKSFDAEKVRDPPLRNYINEKGLKILEQAELVTPENREKLIEESSVIRRKIRGEAIGGLG